LCSDALLVKTSSSLPRWIIDITLDNAKLLEHILRGESRRIINIKFNNTKLRENFQRGEPVSGRSNEILSYLVHKALIPLASTPAKKILIFAQNNKAP
jgi:hypothetical protein